MTSLALESHALASLWERVDDNSLAYAVSGVAGITAFGIDLSGVEAALNANQTPCSSIFASQQHEDASYVRSKGMDGEAGMPDLLAGWESMMPVDLSCSDSPQTPTTHGDAAISNHSGQSMSVLEPGACADSMLAQDYIATSDATDAAGTKVPAAGTAGTDNRSNSIAGPQHSDSRGLQPTAQLSRAVSLSDAVPEAPVSPGSPANSSSSNSTCADNLAAAAAASQSVAAVTAGKTVATDASAVAGTNSTAVIAAALGNAVTAGVPAAGHGSLPSSPRAAMAAAAAAATAAMQRRLLEQQKLSGIVIAPGLLVAANVTHLTKQSQQQVVAPTTAQPATAPASAGAIQESSSAAAAGAPGGNKRTFSTMSLSWAAAATPKQLQAFKAQEAQAAAAVASASGSEPFIRTRSEALARYREKRARRSHVKKIRYQLRKINADKRPRIKGRFVSKEEMEKLGLLVPDYVDNVDSKSFSASDNIKPGFEHRPMVAAAAVAEAAAAHSNFCWEQQMQQMQYMGASDMLLKYDDAGQDMQLPATSAAAADSAGDSSAAELLPAVLEYLPATGLANEADDLAGMPMEIAGAGSLELHFGEDYLNDVPGDLSHDHHDILML